MIAARLPLPPKSRDSHGRPVGWPAAVAASFALPYAGLEFCRIVAPIPRMDASLTGSQRAYLRGLGQRLGAVVHVGREGVSREVVTELDRRLATDELVKVRFVGAERVERAALCEQLATESGAACVGAVGHTALFYRRQTDAARRQIAFPSN